MCLGKFIYTEGVIIILQNESLNELRFNYVDRYNFDGYLDPFREMNGENIPDKTYIMSLFLMFDKELFDYADCDLLDEFKYLLQVDPGTNTETGTKAADANQECMYYFEITETHHWIISGSTEEVHSIKYSHGTVEFDFTTICKDIKESRSELPWGGETGGSSGSSGPGPGSEPDPLQQIEWNNFNSTPKKLIECENLTSIDRKAWFNLTNGEKIAHLIDAMRYEWKKWENGGHIDLNSIFDFGNIGTDNYSPEFAGRVIINGKTLDIIVSISSMSDDSSYIEGDSYTVPKANGENINGYIKTGYWHGFRFKAENSQNRGAPIFDIQIKLGETNNPFTNGDIFLNAIKECNN